MAHRCAILSQAKCFSYHAQSVPDPGVSDRSPERNPVLGWEKCPLPGASQFTWPLFETKQGRRQKAKKLNSVLKNYSIGRDEKQISEKVRFNKEEKSSRPSLERHRSKVKYSLVISLEALFQCYSVINPENWPNPSQAVWLRWRDQCLELHSLLHRRAILMGVKVRNISLYTTISGLLDGFYLWCPSRFPKTWFL